MQTKSERSFCVFCNDKDINDATFRYVEVIRRGLVAAGFRDFGVTNNASVLRTVNHVLTISCLFAARAWVLHPRVEIIHWFQGIEAVERRYLHGGLKGHLQYLLWSAAEKVLLHKACLKFFVSHEMRQFLGDTTAGKSLVIPCYNATLREPTQDATTRTKNRYSRLDLVYAGSMHPWQCVEDSIQTFSHIKQLRPDATLTLFTREIERAQCLCSAHGLADVQVQSVSPADLLQALEQFSFGFILRDAMDINRVSTPTKLSTYMAAGVIPVLTHATPALVRMLSTTPFKIVTPSPSNHEHTAQLICAMSGTAPSDKEVWQDYQAIFQTYMDDAVYTQRIQQLVQAR